MHGAAQDALRITAEINTGYRTPDEVRALLAELTGKPIDDSVVVFPPFYSEFGKNLTLGKNVFINIGCRFQDTGGITIGDGTLIGHGSTLTTLNHGVDPDRRADMIPAPIAIGRKVWLGAAVTVVPGVTHRRRRDRRRRRRRDQGRPRQRDRRRRPRQAHPHDRLRRPAEMSPCFCSNARSTPRTPANANPASGPTPSSRAVEDPPPDPLLPAPSNGVSGSGSWA